MNVVIIEDEKLNAEHLSLLLQKIDITIKVIAVFDSVKKSVEAFKNGIKSDVIFVDIHLADGLSFEIFSTINIETPIVFTTAYNEYAIKAFEVNSIDYLLKPIGIDDLKRAIEKFKKYNVSSHTKVLNNIAQAYNNLNKQYKTRFMVKMGESISSITVENINHFIAEDGIVLLCTSNFKRYPVDFTLDKLEQVVAPEIFFRINRKVLINFNAVVKVVSHFNGRLKIISTELTSDDAIVSRERVNDFKQWLDK